MDYINEPKITIDDIDDQLITDSTTYAARTNKFRAIIYGTAAYSSIDPSTYPDGVIYLQYTE